MTKNGWRSASRSNERTCGGENLGAWFRTIVARVSLNMLRARRAKHEEPVERIPDPLVSPPDETDPSGRPSAVLGFTITGGRIVEINVLSDPRRLSELDLSRIESG